MKGKECIHVTMYLCYNVPMLQYTYVTMYLCYNVPMLQNKCLPQWTLLVAYQHTPYGAKLMIFDWPTLSSVSTIASRNRVRRHGVFAVNQWYGRGDNVCHKIPRIHFHWDWDKTSS